MSADQGAEATENADCHKISDRSSVLAGGFTTNFLKKMAYFQKAKAKGKSSNYLQ